MKEKNEVEQAIEKFEKAEALVPACIKGRVTKYDIHRELPLGESADTKKPEFLALMDCVIQITDMSGVSALAPDYNGVVDLAILSDRERSNQYWAQSYLIDAGKKLVAEVKRLREVEEAGHNWQIKAQLDAAKVEDLQKVIEKLTASKKGKKAAAKAG